MFPFFFPPRSIQTNFSVRDKNVDVRNSSEVKSYDSFSCVENSFFLVGGCIWFFYQIDRICGNIVINSICSLVFRGLDLLCVEQRAHHAPVARSLHDYILNRFAADFYSYLHT